MASDNQAGWLERRTGYRGLLAALLDEPIPGGPSFAYVFGSLLLFLFVNQAVTGFLLMTTYSPSAASAWASVAYIQDQVQLGWFIRGMHSAGASFVVIGMALHMLQVALYGAYRAPRELNWLLGILLAMLMLGFALTGYLLPWDQKGYWATQVATSLLGAAPRIGPALQSLLQGGPTYGNLTVTRFYALHVFALPVLTGLIILAHVALFRRHGVTPHWRRTADELRRRTAPFWPQQAVYDLAAALALLALLVVWVVRTHGADLDAPADPAAPYEARPEWYFLPLYQLLKYFPGSLEVVAALSAPALFFGALALLPVLDRGRGPADGAASPWQRRLPLSVFGAAMAVVIGLGVLAARADRADIRHQKEAEQNRLQAQRARKLALEGVPPEGGVAVYKNDPLEKGRLLFREHCAGCHVLGAMGPSAADQKGPELTGLYSRPWLLGFLRGPESDRYFGKTKLQDGMKAVSGGEEELLDLVEYLLSLGGGAAGLEKDRVARGAVLFEDRNCDLCHARDGKASEQGPNLGGYGSGAWLKGLLNAPGSPLYYGEKNDMPAFDKKLSPAQQDSLILFLQAQRSAR